jgi:hypothetical protein
MVKYTQTLFFLEILMQKRDLRESQNRYRVAKKGGSRLQDQEIQTWSKIYKSDMVQVNLF